MASKGRGAAFLLLLSLAASAAGQVVPAARPAGPAPMLLPASGLGSSDGASSPLAPLDLSHQGAPGALEIPPAVLPGTLPGPAAAALLPAVGLAAPEALPGPGEAAAADPESRSPSVAGDYGAFLVQLGFERYSERMERALEREDLSPAQRKVLRRNAERLRVLDSARELAARVMAGVYEQGRSEESLDRALDLTLRLITLNPLAPPARSEIPPEAAGDVRETLRWLGEETARRIGRQSAAVASDAARAAYGPQRLASAIESGSKEAASDLAVLHGHVERLLTARYLDIELGQTRYAGRALAASLVRYGNLAGRPDLLRRLEEGLSARGHRLSDYVGDSLTLTDAAGAERTFRIRTGDIVGSRFRSRRASLIAFGARPYWTRWLRSVADGLLGNPLGIWMKPPGNAPFQAPRQPLRNALRRWIFALRTRLAFSPWLLRGYGHVGMASVQEADGVAMTWVWESEVDTGQGGIRKVGLADEFLKTGHHARFGVATWDADALYQEFQRQARERPFAERAHEAKGGWLASGVTREEHARLVALPRSEADRLQASLAGYAVRNIESLMADFGMAYDFGFFGRIYRANCAATLELAYKLAQFEFQTRPDHWNRLARLLRFLGAAYGGGLDMRSRPIFLGSLFVDPKVAAHSWAYLPGKEEAYRDGDPYLMDAYQEADPALTRALREFLARAGAGDFSADAKRISRTLRSTLLARRMRQRGTGWRNAFSLAVGYMAGASRFLRGGA